MAVRVSGLPYSSTTTSSTIPSGVPIPTGTMAPSSSAASTPSKMPW